MLRLTGTTRSKQTALIAVLAVTLGLPLPVFAETVASAGSPGPVEGYTMMSWLNTMGIVEQLQTIHRYSQSASPQAWMGLVTALHSPFPLARRKASKSLLDKARVAQEDEKRLLAQSLPENALNASDPVVQRNLVRLLAQLNLPEAQETLRQFFKGSDKKAQLVAVDALSHDDAQAGKAALQTAKQLSPYSEVREAAKENLE